jgi:hypothetical protein
MGAVEMRESVSIVLTDEKPSPILIAKGEVLFFFFFFFLSSFSLFGEEERRREKEKKESFL